jgi:hypothetical protein
MTQCPPFTNLSAYCTTWRSSVAGLSLRMYGDANNQFGWWRADAVDPGQGLATWLSALPVVPRLRLDVRVGSTSGRRSPRGSRTRSFGRTGSCFSDTGGLEPSIPPTRGRREKAGQDETSPCGSACLKASGRPQRAVAGAEEPGDCRSWCLSPPAARPRRVASERRVLVPRAPRPENTKVPTRELTGRRSWTLHRSLR